MPKFTVELSSSATVAARDGADVTLTAEPQTFSPAVAVEAVAAGTVLVRSAEGSAEMSFDLAAGQRAEIAGLALLCSTARTPSGTLAARVAWL